MKIAGRREEWERQYQRRIASTEPAMKIAGRPCARPGACPEPALQRSRR